MKLEFKKTLKNWKALTIFSLIFSFNFNAHSSCEKIDSKYKDAVRKNFLQSPFEMIDSLQVIGATSSEQDKKQAVFLSFDLKALYSSIYKVYPSKLLASQFLNYNKELYFSLFDALYSKQKGALNSKYYDLVASRDRAQLDSNKLSFSKIKLTSCSKRQKQALKCPSIIYKVTALHNPTVSCINNDLKKAQTIEYYLTHSKKLGFKIIDFSFSGRKVISENILSLKKLKRQGYKKDALLSYVKSLSSTKDRVKGPKSLYHSNRILVLSNSSSNDGRLPASL